MGWISRAIAAGGAYRNDLAEVRDGLFIGEGNTAAKLSQFWLLLALSSIVAAGGVIGDSTPADCPLVDAHTGGLPIPLHGGSAAPSANHAARTGVQLSDSSTSFRRGLAGRLSPANRVRQFPMPLEPCILDRVCFARIMDRGLGV